ncbi:MAG: type II toxin-antitoxin system HicB family antitoxin [Erysipelotrichaceae bacterium]|nr:type II toxin-antitoxin system HicB family antitoxin [Erysipelotrichaceae bacterium]
MAKIYYPALFHVAEDIGGYWVEFPDLPGCLTEGRNEVEAMEMAEDALGLWLDRTGETWEREILPPSTCEAIRKQFPDELVMMVGCDPEEWYRRTHSRAIKKTLTIPAWLNERATKANLNFSKILKEALIDKLGL